MRVGEINDLSTGPLGTIILVTGLQIIAALVWTLFVGPNEGTFFVWLFPAGWKALLFYVVPAAILFYCAGRIGEKLTYRLLRKGLAANVVFGD
jgi:hypothetical protein